MQATLSRHLQRIVVAEMPIEHQVVEWEAASHQGYELLDHAPDAVEFFGQRHLSLVSVLAYGRPGFLLGVSDLCLWAFFGLAPAAAFSMLLLTTCSILIGNERRALVLTSDSAKKARPGTAFP